MSEKAFNYQEEAAVTVSHDWHGDKVAFELFAETLRDCIGSLRKLDAIKKSIFYGRDFPGPKHFGPDCNGLGLGKRSEYVVHGIIGVATEAGEMLELLHDSFVDGKPFDEINLKEEQGDSFWYHALLANTFGFTFDEIQRTNIAKLRARFPNKFTAYDANNRDLDKEREILEGGSK